MNTTAYCAQCGATLPGGLLQGLCPRCVARQAAAILAAPSGAAAPPDVPALPAGEGTGEGSSLPPSTPMTEAPGDRIGHYKLLQQIGEGGCGVVYMAEQEQPVRRRVALKVIKLGMDTRQVIARFEAERQALALMDHPNIAKVFDAGATETGRPFFVMELVRGIKITDFCDENNLPTQDRLKLFIQVCQAIQHAHQKGIIHRDIKPSNILVTLNDGVPMPKVIDFGIAKATQGKLADHTVFTAFEQFIGTPAYMSPEQAEMSALDVDTRSDIYSLGVLLYELLTGQTPFDTRALLQAGLNEIRRIIREEEPARPSTRLSTMAAAALTTVAKQRHTEPARLSSLVRGELDWIVMKALEKDRTRRYETANGLARDVMRYLSDEPVVASPPSRWYRLRKLVRRNRLVFIAAMSVTAALLLGFGVSTRLYFQERRAKALAVRSEKRAQAGETKAYTEAAKNAQTAQFLKDMLQSVGPSVALGRDTAMMREILDQTAKRLSTALTNQPEVEVDLRLTLAGTYAQLGLYDQEEKMARTALQVARSRWGEQNLQTAAALVEIGEALRRQGKLPDAESATREGLTVQTNLLGGHHLTVANSMKDMALILRDEGKLPPADALLRQALKTQREVLGQEHTEIADTLVSLSDVVRNEGRLPESQALAREALEMFRKLLGNDHPSVANALSTLANVLWEEGKAGEAEPVLRDALTTQRKVFGDEHPEVANTLNTLAVVLAEETKLVEAETNVQEALKIQRKRFGNEHPDIAASLGNLALVLVKQQRLAGAETVQREALAMQIKLFGREHLDVANSLNSLAAALGGQGKFAEAEKAEREALAIQRKLLGGEHPEVANSLNTLANLLRQQGNLPEAIKLQRESLAMRTKVLGSGHPEVIIGLANVAVMLRTEGKLAEAETMQREVLAGQRKLVEIRAPSRDAALNNLVLALRQLAITQIAREEFVEAESNAVECLSIAEKQLPDDFETYHAHELVGASLLGQKKYEQAEPLLLAGYDGMRQRAARIPALAGPPLKSAVERLVRLYEATGRPEKAEEWKKKLAEFNRAQPPQP